MNGSQFLDCGGNGLRIGLCSRGLVNFKTLPAFLGLPEAKFGYAVYANRKNFDLFLGWGRKPSGEAAVRYSEACNRPFLLLEDGFLRSVFPASVAKSQPLSLVTDEIGIYYDATAPSQLEQHIREAIEDPSRTQAAGAEVLETLRRKQLCKYNNFAAKQSDLPALQEEDDHVLVIDQTAGDLSVAGAGASAQDFSRMLEAALDENPNSKVLVKSHPETSAGTRKGYLSAHGDRDRCQLVTQPINPWELLAKVSRVYAVSSQLGFDALLAGKDVRCFGMPFYAGWNLSQDEQQNPRRAGFHPTVEQIAWAAYRKYSRYLDPYEQSLTGFTETAQTLKQLSAAAGKTADIGPITGIYPWTRNTVRAMFQLHRPRQRFVSSDAQAIALADRQDSAIAAWSSRLKPQTAAICADKNIPVNRIEDGFVRSVGLGTNFHQPMSLVVDSTGIYYDSSKPSDLEALLNCHEFDELLLKRAERIIDWLRESNISKYNLHSSETLSDLPHDQTKILVPGQVEDDASVLHSGSQLKTSEQLLQTVRTANPDAHIVFKPHPDVLSGQRKGLLSSRAVPDLINTFAENVSILDAISRCDEVHTLTSLSGFEALIRNKPVTCYGLPFYAGWGLTSDKLTCERRTRQLSLEALIAGSLILYPNYFDPVSNLPCPPEIVMKRIDQIRQNPGSLPALVRARTMLGKMRKLRRFVMNR